MTAFILVDYLRNTPVYHRENTGSSEITFCTITVTITQSPTKDEGDIIKSSKVDDILKYLNDNYTKDISVTDVAD